MTTEELDPRAVQRDAALVQALSTRSVHSSSQEEFDLSDPVVAHLVAWVDWIDSDIDDVVLDFSGRDPGKDRVVALDPSSSRRRGRAVLVTGATIAALVVSSGAAAAVTGDPLAIARAPLNAIERINPFAGGGAENAKETLPDPAPPVAEANKLLADAQRALATGHPEKAQSLLDQATALLGDAATKGQQQRIDHVVDAIATPNDPSAQGNGQGQGQGHQGRGQGHQGQGQGHQGQGQGQGHQAQGKGQGQTGNGAVNGSDPSANSGKHTGRDAGGGQSPAPTGGGSPGGTGGQGPQTPPKGQTSGEGDGKPDTTGAGSGAASGGHSGAPTAPGGQPAGQGKP